MSSAEKTPVSLADLPPCPVETTLTLISDKWKVLILRDLLLHGTMRFGELKKSIVEYSLTELGFSLHPIMDAMWDWGEAYKKKLAQEEDAAANA